MKFGFPWRAKAIRPDARETAKAAARRSGMSLDDWLNAAILQQVEKEGVEANADFGKDSYGVELATVNARLDNLARRIEQLAPRDLEAYAPKRDREAPDRLAQTIGQPEQPFDEFANTARPAPTMQAAKPPATPKLPLPPSLGRALAEIAARQRVLNGDAPPPRQDAEAATISPAPTFVAAPPLAPEPMPEPALAQPAPMPAQDLSGLEDQLRKINDQIETLHKPGVEEAIDALREELGEIGRALNDAMPRHALEAVDQQIQELSRRIAEGRQAGADAAALAGIEHGLAEVRDALRGLTPAENLVGFYDAVDGLAHKIDLIIAEKDPATMAQLESAITTLREMITHIASNETVNGLAAQVHALGEKIETMASAGPGGDALNHLEQRIATISDTLAAGAQNGTSAPPHLDALVASLADKIEQLLNSHGNSDAFGHLEDRIVQLVEKLDASDSRLGHLEAIERGMADLLVHIEDLRANKDASGLHAQDLPAVDDLKQDIARTQNTLDAVHDALSQVVDRLAGIEKGIRSEPRPRAADSEGSLGQPAGGIAVHAIDNPPGAAAPIPAPATATQSFSPSPLPRHLPPAGHQPIDPDLPGDQPLEPGSGPPPMQNNPAARLAASEAALGGSRTAAPGGKSSFIAAARRAAQAAGQDPNARAPRPELADAHAGEDTSLGSKVIKRVKSLFIAASIVAIVVGSIQIAGNVFNLGISGTKTAETPAIQPDETEAAKDDTVPETTASIASSPLAQPTPPETLPPAVTSEPALIAPVPPPPQKLNQTTSAMPSLFSPPMLAPPTDITGSIPSPADNSQATKPAAPVTLPGAPLAGQLPIAIGGAHLRSAAAAGDAAAAYEVAMRYAEGRGVPADMAEAARWYERAAGKGLTAAQFHYASLLEKGLGVKKDLIQARRLYLAAATKGNSKAMHNLAVLYAEGIDGKPDYGTAVQWFRKAAQRGVADSQFNLGVLCARGLGTDEDYGEAYKWFALAAAQGDKEAAKKRDDIAGQMDASALAAARQDVAAFVPEPQPKEAIAVPQPPGGWDHATRASAPRPKTRAAAPLSLGSIQVGKR